MVVKITAQNTNDATWFGLAKYAWSGAVIECPNCGEIFRARQYWYGNKTPEDTSVRWVIEFTGFWREFFFYKLCFGCFFLTMNAATPF